MKKNVIIVGAGFGGVTAALKISKKLRNRPEYEIILIDQNPFQLYTPALYEIAALPKEYSDDTTLASVIAIPLKEAARQGRFTFWRDRLTGLDAQHKKIALRDRGEIYFAHLVLALGSETDYFGIPGLKEYGLPLKTFTDGTRLRGVIEERVLRRETMTILVGGAGMSGVELAAELTGFICVLRDKIMPGLKCRVEILLVEAAPDILPGFDARVVEKAKKRLRKLGVNLKTGARIVQVLQREVVFEDNTRHNFDVLVWTGGVKGPEVIEKLGFPFSPKGTLPVNELLEVEGGGGAIIAIGDSAFFINPLTKKPLAWNVPAAEAEGRSAAENIIREISGKAKKEFSPLKKYPYVLAIGKKYAIADLVFVRFSGLLGWCAKQLIEFRYLLLILPLKQALRMWLKGLGVFGSND